jgi:hypothetical protein
MLGREALERLRLIERAGAYAVVNSDRAVLLGKHPQFRASLLKPVDLITRFGKPPSQAGTKANCAAGQWSTGDPADDAGYYPYRAQQFVEIGKERSKPRPSVGGPEEGNSNATLNQTSLLRIR